MTAAASASTTARVLAPPPWTTVGKKRLRTNSDDDDVTEVVGAKDLKNKKKRVVKKKASQLEMGSGLMLKVFVMNRWDGTLDRLGFAKPVATSRGGGIEFKYTDLGDDSPTSVYYEISRLDSNVLSFYGNMTLRSNVDRGQEVNVSSRVLRTYAKYCKAVLIVSALDIRTALSGIRACLTSKAEVVVGAAH